MYVYVREMWRELRVLLFFASRGDILAYIKWGNFDSPPPEAHASETQLEATPRSRGFPQPSADRGSAARVGIAGCRAGEVGLASPTSRGARAPSPSPAARWKAPRASRTPQPGCRCRSKAPAAPASGSLPSLTSGPEGPERVP